MIFVRRQDQPPEAIADTGTYAALQSGMIPCFGIQVANTAQQQVHFRFSVFERQCGVYDLFAWQTNLAGASNVPNQVCVLAPALRIDPHAAGQ